MAYASLNPEKALIWRIVNKDSLPWILDNGLHCANSEILAPNYVNIGNVDLIDKRRHRKVLIQPGGTLADYVPFYFTPFSVMMMNIHSGRSVKKRENDEIVILVSSLYRCEKLNIPFIFTNAHAYPEWTNYYSDIKHVGEIDWKLLQDRDFKRDPDDPRKIERYQAEALIHKHLPVEALVGIVCYTEQIKNDIEKHLQQKRIVLPTHARPGWYFQ